MRFDVQLLTFKKHHETQHAEVEWSRALETARQSLKFIEMNDLSLEHIALASASPRQFTAIVRLIYQYGKSHPHGARVSDLVLGHVNDSPFSLSDWLDAIEYFYGWLEKNQRNVDFLSMLNYLECCVASQDARESGQTLAALVEDMLRVAGYKGEN